MPVNAHKTAWILALACTVSMPYALASGPPPALKDAIASYNSHQYIQAVAQMKSLSGADADSPYTHYYMALSYQALGRFQEADREYRWNYQNSKDPDLRYKSWQGLQGLQSLSRTRSASSSAVGSSTGSSGNSRVASAASSKNVKAPTWEELGFKPKATGNADNLFKMNWTPGCVRHR